VIFSYGGPRASTRRPQLGRANVKAATKSRSAKWSTTPPVPWYQLVEPQVQWHLPITDGQLSSTRCRNAHRPHEARRRHGGVERSAPSIRCRNHSLPTRRRAVLVDAAQSVPHMRTDVQASIALFAFSGHKMPAFRRRYPYGSASCSTRFPCSSAAA
jgi:hypothetical protein